MGTLLEILQYGSYSDLVKYFLDVIPFVLITIVAIVALVLSILNYRTNKKILKKLEEQKDGG